MKVIEIRDDSGLDSLGHAERPDPEPGPGQVLVRIRASSINYRDLGNVLDPVGRGINPPFIPDSDGAGEVEAVGPGVTRFQPGDKVVTCFMQNWIDGTMTKAATDSALGGMLEGVLCERAVLSEQGLVRQPDHLSFEEGTTLTCAGLTAWQAVVEKGRVKAGDTVLLLGTGGVSIFGLQFAKMHGARVIITSSSDDKLARTRALGADETINYKTHPDWEAEVMRLTDGRGADQVLEVGGIGTLEKSALLTRKGGTLHGIYVGSRKMFEDMNRAIAEHGMHPVIDQVFDFDNGAEAFRAMKAQGHFGKLVIRV